jgi:hypoxanthine phosphoribosyltransferase
VSSAMYGLLWTIVAPLGIPNTIENPPSVMKSRAFFHVLLTLLAGAYVTLLIDLILRRKNWSRMHGTHDPTLPVGKEGLSLDDIRTAIEILSTDAQAFAPDFIYGINRGGAIVGGFIAKQLKIPHVYLLTVNCDRSPEHRVVEHRAHRKPPSGKVLLVDDAKRKGEHMREAAAFLTSRYKGIALRRVAVLELRVPHQGPEKTVFRDDQIDRSAFFTNDASVMLPWDPW